MSKNAADQDGVRIDEAARQVTISGGPGEDRSSARQSGPRSTRRLSGGQRALVGVVAALSVALIGVSAWFLVLPGDSGSLTDGVLQTTVEPSAATDSSKRDGSAQEGEIESKTTEQEDGKDSQVGDGSLGSSSLSSEAQGETGLSTGGAEQQHITVFVYIDSSRVASHGWPSCMASTEVNLNNGDSVYDALCQTGVSVPPSSNYVSSINGLSEFTYGTGSGWMYSVNGWFPNYGCGSYPLSGGESIRWVYTLDLGKDL